MHTYTDYINIQIILIYRLYYMHIYTYYLIHYGLYIGLLKEF